MIYKLKLYNLTFITSGKKNNNYGRDQIALFGKYRTTSNQQILLRILIKPNMILAVDRFKYLNNALTLPQSASIVLHAVSSVLSKLVIPYSVHLLSSDWVQGYGSSIGLNDKSRATSGVTWYSKNGFLSWDLLGGDYNSTASYTGSIVYNHLLEDLNINIPCLNLTSYNGYIIIPSLTIGQINYLTTNQMLSVNIKPHILFKLNDYDYITGSMEVVSTINKDIVVGVHNSSLMVPYSKQRFYIDVNYLYLNKQVGTNAQLRTKLAVTALSYYLIVLFKTKLTIIQMDLTYSRVSCNGEYNYFDIITNYFLKNKYYSINIYIDGIKYLTGYRFRVL